MNYMVDSAAPSLISTTTNVSIVIDNASGHDNISSKRDESYCCSISLSRRSRCEIGAGPPFPSCCSSRNNLSIVIDHASGHDSSIVNKKLPSRCQDRWNNTGKKQSKARPQLPLRQATLHDRRELSESELELELELSDFESEISSLGEWDCPPDLDSITASSPRPKYKPPPCRWTAPSSKTSPSSVARPQPPKRLLTNERNKREDDRNQTEVPPMTKLQIKDWLLGTGNSAEQRWKAISNELVTTRPQLPRRQVTGQSQKSETENGRDEDDDAWKKEEEWSTLLSQKDNTVLTPAQLRWMTTSDALTTRQQDGTTDTRASSKTQQANETNAGLQNLLVALPPAAPAVSRWKISPETMVMSPPPQPPTRRQDLSDHHSLSLTKCSSSHSDHSSSLSKCSSSQHSAVSTKRHLVSSSLSSGRRHHTANSSFSSFLRSK